MLLLGQLCCTCLAQNMTIKTPFVLGKKRDTTHSTPMLLNVFFLRSEPTTAFCSRKVSKQFQQKRSEQIAGRCRKSFREGFGENNVLFFVNALQMMCVIQFFFLKHRRVECSCQVENHDIENFHFVSSGLNPKKLKNQENRSWLLEPQFFGIRKYTFNLNFYFCESIIQLKPKSRSGRKKIKQIYFHSSAKLSFCSFFGSASCKSLNHGWQLQDFLVELLQSIMLSTFIPDQI